MAEDIMAGFAECDRLFQEYFLTGQYEKCFEGHLTLARKSYPIAECQVGYFYHEGIGVEKDLAKSLYWTQRAALHDYPDAQYHLAVWFYLTGDVISPDQVKAKEWLVKAASGGCDEAVLICRGLGYEFDA